VTARLVAATNCELERRVASGRFREDLPFRVEGATVVPPPLRERREDVAPLPECLLARRARELGCTRPGSSPRAKRLSTARRRVLTDPNVIE
jgi:DNA-binding NtrC family response regulator